MVHEELIETLPLYAAGALDRAERQEIDTHLLTGCPACHTELREFQAVASVLPYSLAPVTPPRTLKAKIMASRPGVMAAEGETQQQKPSLEPGEWMKHLFPPSPRFPSWAHPAFAVLGLIFAASFLYMGYAAYVRTKDGKAAHALKTEVQTAQQQISGLEQQMRNRDAMLATAQATAAGRDAETKELREAIILREAEIEDLRNQLEQRDKDSAALRRARSQIEEIAGLFRSASARAVPLSGSDGGRASAGLLLFDQKNGKAFLYAYNLPTLPADQTYQVWAIDVKPFSAGLFTPDVGQKGRLSIKGLATGARITRFAVTVEPAGGRPEPSGPIYLSGQL